MPSLPEPQPGISDITLYQGGASHVDGVLEPLKLSSNENPWGASPKALAAAAEAAAQLHRYPNTDHSALRAAIAQTEGLDPARIICGSGSDEIIAFLCQAYAGSGDEVLHTEHGFAMYRISAMASGATPVEVPERRRQTDVDAILKGVTDRTRLVFLANPNNPTGTMIGGNELRRLAAGLPENCLLVLDGAYAEFVEGYDAGASLIDDFEHVFMTRTFSKIHGLGGLRVGWGYGAQDVINTLNRIRGPFNLSHVALAAAKAAILDTGFRQQCHAENIKQRQRLTNGLARIGFPCDSSSANFVLARTRSPEEATAADAFLKERGILIRLVAGYKLPSAIRITVGTGEDITRVLEVLSAFREVHP